MLSIQTQTESTESALIWQYSLLKLSGFSAATAPDCGCYQTAQRFLRVNFPRPRVNVVLPDTSRSVRGITIRCISSSSHRVAGSGVTVNMSHLIRYTNSGVSVLRHSWAHCTGAVFIRCRKRYVVH